MNNQVSAKAPVLSARNVQKSFIGGDGTRLDILLGIDLDVGSGERIAITGASGTGKSTLLHILGSLDRPSSGKILVDRKAVSDLSEDELAEMRNHYVAQTEARDRSRELLEEVGVIGRESHKPRQLSGGEQQRVAVARALVNQPLVLLADEPSGNLDTQTSQRLHDLIFGLQAGRELSMVVVTHNLDLARRADRVLVLQEGRLELAPKE